MKSERSQRVYLLGASGRLGKTLLQQWRHHQKADSIIPLSRQEIDFLNPLLAQKNFSAYDLCENDLVINCAALTDVDYCESEAVAATAVNATTPAFLAEVCAQKGARFLQLSTDYVFDGTLDRPYEETDEPAPINHYGISKLIGEQRVIATSEQHIIARISWVFGPGCPSLIDQILQEAMTSKKVVSAVDRIASPSFTHDLIESLGVFLNSSVKGGIYHLCNTGACSWYEYGTYVLKKASDYGMPVRTTEIIPTKLYSMKQFRTHRPLKTPLNTNKFRNESGLTFRPWQEAVDEYLEHVQKFYSRLLRRHSGI